jgi:aminoglycoside phosphotransferase (APT) family kinase protein
MAQHSASFTQENISRLATESPFFEISRKSIQSISEMDIIDRYEASTSHLTARKISETVVVKRCMAGEREFENLEHAWSLLNGIRLASKRVLRIPEPLRYFELADHDGFTSGYIVMECFDGETMETGLNEENLSDVAEAISRVHYETGRYVHTRPGPLDGGLADGFPWGEDRCESLFRNVADLQQCLDKRLQSRTGSRGQCRETIDLRNMELVFCHGDYALRNIMLLRNGDIGILDWANAAYYPAVFELGSLKYSTSTCAAHQKKLVARLLQDLESKIAGNKSDIETLCIVHQQSIGHSCK